MERTILVADDDFDNRTIIAAALKAAGFGVCEAKDGQEALELANERLPDLILMDMSMPRLSGWDATASLKRSERTRRIPVFAFTAYALAGDELKAKEAGCDGYVSKPCLPRDVVRKIVETLGGPNRC